MLNTELVSDGDELAAIYSEMGKKYVVVIEKPELVSMTCDTGYDVSASIFDQDHYDQRDIRVRMEVVGRFKEEITGRNADEALPDVVEDMSVEELLRVVNSKLQEEGV